MNCHRARWDFMRERPGARAKAHVRTCADCRQWVDRDERLRRLLRAHGVQAAEEAQRAAAHRLPVTAWLEVERRRELARRWFPTFSLPIARYALAATVLALAVFHWLAHPRGLLSLPEPAGAKPQIASPWGPSSVWVSSRVAPPDSLEAAGFAYLPWLESTPISVTNMSAAGIHYGIGVRLIHHYLRAP